MVEGDQTCPNPEKDNPNSVNDIQTKKIFRRLYPDGEDAIEKPFVQMTCMNCPRTDLRGFCIDMREADKKHSQDAQLLLWRERPDDKARAAKFYVSLVGASGPSTLALTSLLVDNGQKTEMLQLVDKQENLHLLSNLQEMVRKKLITRYLDALDTALVDVDLDIVFKIKYAVSMYLGTVLYHYFLPFLSKKDENRIYNGMAAFVTAMYTADYNHFDNVIKYRDTIELVLKSVITSFRGVEAFYEVNVTSEDTVIDSRKVIGITELMHNEKLAVSCLFCEK